MRTKLFGNCFLTDIRHATGFTSKGMQMLNQPWFSFLVKVSVIRQSQIRSKESLASDATAVLIISKINALNIM